MVGCYRNYVENNNKNNVFLAEAHLRCHFLTIVSICLQIPKKWSCVFLQLWLCILVCSWDLLGRCSPVICYYSLVTLPMKSHRLSSLEDSQISSKLHDISFQCWYFLPAQSKSWIFSATVSHQTNRPKL